MRTYLKLASFVFIFACATAIGYVRGADLESCDNVEPERAQKDCLQRNIETLQAEIKDRILTKCRSDAAEGSGAALETLACPEQRFRKLLQDAQ